MTGFNERCAFCGDENAAPIVWDEAAGRYRHDIPVEFVSYDFERYPRLEWQFSQGRDGVYVCAECLTEKPDEIAKRLKRLDAVIEQLDVPDLDDSEDTRRVTTTLSEADHARLDEVSKAFGTSMSKVIKLMVHVCLEDLYLGKTAERNKISRKSAPK
jgi:hypothetical protein